MDYYKKYIKYKQKYNNLNIYNSFLPDKLKQEYKSIRYIISNENSLFPYSNRTVQIGGGSKLHKWVYKNKTYTFNINTMNYKDSVEISLISKSKQECAIATVSKKNNTAIIVNIFNFNDCVLEGSSFNPGGGDKLMRFMLEYIRSNKNKYNIKRIILKDNSIIYCNKCSDNIKLSQLRSVTHGTPLYLYIKYKFKFYNPKTRKPDNRYKKEIYNNAKIIKHLKMSEINIKEIITNTYKYEHKYVSKDQLTKIFKLSQKCKYVREYILELSKNFNSNCCVIKYLLDYLYKGGLSGKSLLFDFHGMDYYLDL
jgi:hypothetical protein